MDKNRKVEENTSTGVLAPVYEAVRCVGALKPVFDPRKNLFKPPELTVGGTGFWVRDCGLFVTCAHVVQKYLGRSIDELGMLVVGGNGHQFERATIVVVDYQHDLALLDVSFPTKEVFEKEVKTGLLLAGADPDVSVAVAYAGFPFGQDLLDSKQSPTYAEGCVGKSILHEGERTEIQFSGPVVGGYSGAPVVLKSEPDKLVGVLSNGPVEDGNTGNIFRGIHWKHVLALCKMARA